MNEVFYISNNNIYKAKDSGPIALGSQALKKFERNIREIEKKKEWKRGKNVPPFVNFNPENDVSPSASVTSVCSAGEDKLIYAANLESVGGLYTKNPSAPEDPEGYILRKENLQIYDINYSGGRIAASVSEDSAERHLALFGEDDSSLQILTEGDSIDRYPSFSQSDPDTVYYSSAGMYFEGGLYKGHGKYGIIKLNLSTGEIADVKSDNVYDYIKPAEHESGIYCIRRGKSAKSGAGNGILADILLFPFRIIKALLGFLNVFSKSFAGESLIRQTPGANPAKTNQKNEKSIFVEGNIINAEKSLKDNAGDKYPGIAPRNWELVSLSPDGKTEVIKKAVLDYKAGHGFIVYSNGKYVVRMDSDGTETRLCAADVAASISFA